MSGTNVPQMKICTRSLASLARIRLSLIYYVHFVHLIRALNGARGRHFRQVLPRKRVRNWPRDSKERTTFVTSARSASIKPRDEVTSLLLCTTT